MSRTRKILIALAVVAVGVVALAGTVVATRRGDDSALVVYTARLHYGEEAAFRKFTERTGQQVELFGGSGPELNERLRAEGEASKADILITVDAGNLLQAKRAGLLEPLRSRVLERNVPAELRDPGGQWFGLTTRARTIMRSTERVPAREAPQTYEALGDPRFEGRLCLRTSDSVYNSSFVADQIAKHGGGRTERMLRTWMRNEPTILGSDVSELEAIAAGKCDVALANHYYLARQLAEDPRFPVAPVWANQDGRGTHVNISGYGVARNAPHREAAIKLVEYLSTPAAQSEFAQVNDEFPVNPRAKVPPLIERWRGFKTDPIDVGRAGGLPREAVKLMNEVGWK